MASRLRTAWDFLANPIGTSSKAGNISTGPSGPFDQGAGAVALRWQFPAMSAAGVPITDETARTVAAWYTAIRVISEDIAGLPFITYRRNGRNKDRATDHRVYGLLHDTPNPEMTAFVFRETLQAHLLSWGNAYAEKELSSTGEVLGLWPLRPDRMTVTWSGGQRVYDYQITAMSAPTRFTSRQIFHIPGLGYDGLVGYSPLRMARETLGQAIALREYGSRVLANDARPSVYLKHPASLSDKARANLRESWEASHGGFTNAGRMALLEEGMDLKEVGFPPEDIQFLESQKWSVAEIARWHRLAPHKIGDLERATFTNIEEQNIDHATSALRAWCTRWEQQANKDLLLGAPNLFTEHLLDAFMRGKTYERYQAFALAVQNKAMVPNEWRAFENWNPVPWGDEPIETPNNSAGTPAPVAPEGQA